MPEITKEKATVNKTTENLFRYKKYILRWITSAETVEQLDLLKKIVKEFVEKRFTSEAEEFKGLEKWGLEQEIIDSKTELRNTIEARALQLVAKRVGKQSPMPRL